MGGCGIAGGRRSCGANPPDSLLGVVAQKRGEAQIQADKGRWESRSRLGAWVEE